MKTKQRLIYSVAVLALLALSGCGGSAEQDAAAAKANEPRQSIDQLYNAGISALARDEYKVAIGQFEDLERDYPYSEWAVRGQVMTAFANYKSEKYDVAMAGLDRFLRMHPTHESAPYAFYLKALCSYDQISDVGRDQKMTAAAMDGLRDVVDRFPDSDYARDALIKLDLTVDHLAGKEMDVGRYYQKRAQYIAAANRFRNVVEKYQTTTHVPEALLRLVEIYLALGVTDEAVRYGSVLGYNFPASDWYRKAYADLAAQGLAPALKDDALVKMPEKSSWWDKLVP